MSVKRDFVCELDGYDSEAREFGDCGIAALFSLNNGGVMTMPICGLEVGHSGPHEWDPEYVYEDDEDGAS